MSPMSEYDSNPEGQDDALPAEAALQQAMNLLLGDGRSTPAPAAPEPAESSSPSSSSSSSAPRRLRPGTTPAQIKEYITKLESDPAWAKADDPNHAELHRRLRAAYQHLDAAPEAPAPTPHPMQQRAQASRATTEKKIAALESSEAWRSAAHPDHAKVMSELRQLYQGAHPEPAGELQELPPLSDALRAAGLERPTLPGPLTDRLDQDALADFAVWTVQEGLGSQKAQAILSAWQQEQVLNGRAWTGPRPGDYERWGQRLTTEFGLTKRQADQLLGWYRARLGEGA